MTELAAVEGISKESFGVDFNESGREEGSCTLEGEVLGVMGREEED